MPKGQKIFSVPLLPYDEVWIHGCSASHSVQFDTFQTAVVSYDSVTVRNLIACNQKHSVFFGVVVANTNMFKKSIEFNLFSLR